MNATAPSSSIETLYAQVNERLASKAIEVPMLPEVAGRVLRTTQDPDSDAGDLSKLIQSDQSLAAHVMRIANSAAYSPNSTLVSLQQAITRLGMKVIAEIALAASINSSLFNTPGFEKHIAYILKTSLAAGLWAKESARACRKNVEAAFLAGLLHDIGRPVAVQMILELAAGLQLNLEQKQVFDIENKIQRKIGLHVLEQWEMPSTVCSVVEYFDRYQTAHAGQLQTSIVVAGKAIATHFMCDSDVENCPTVEELLEHPVFAEINLYKDEITQLLEKEEAVTATMEAMSA